MSVPAFLHRRKMRHDDRYVAANIVALLAEIGGRAYTDRVAADLEIGMGRVIKIRDALVKDGYVTRDRDELVLTDKARTVLMLTEVEMLPTDDAA